MGDLTAFITYITQILMSLMMLTMIFMNSSRALASAQPHQRRCWTRRSTSMTIRRSISRAGRDAAATWSFSNVSFRYYKNSPGKVLDNISLKINAGETVGVVGSTGCGKTTLVSMIPRLYDVDEGEVLVDGVNVRDYDLNQAS